MEVNHIPNPLSFGTISQDMKDILLLVTTLDTRRVMGQKYLHTKKVSRERIMA